ncbi:MAG: hypothetical protein ACI4TG_09990 [Ruminococcus sp.]
MYSDCSLAGFYDEITIPLKLRRTYQLRVLAVMAAMTLIESECVAELMRMYRKLMEE